MGEGSYRRGTRPTIRMIVVVIITSVPKELVRLMWTGDRQDIRRGHWH